MSRSDPLGDYAALLGIRAKGYGRNSAISCFLFLLAFAAFIVSKWAGGAEERSKLLEVVIIVPLGVTWLTTWVRHEIAKAQAELVTTLRDRAGVQAM